MLQHVVVDRNDVAARAVVHFDLTGLAVVAGDASCARALPIAVDTPFPAVYRRFAFSALIRPIDGVGGVCEVAMTIERDRSRNRLRSLFSAWRVASTITAPPSDRRARAGRNANLSARGTDDWRAPRGG